MPYIQTVGSDGAELDYTASMQQTYEFYAVDPSTWADSSQIDTITGATLKRDSSVDTLGSAQYDITGPMNEQYIRTYLIAIQNGVRHKICLGTYLGQGLDDKFDGKVHTQSIDGYTPLIELKEKPPEIGFTMLKGEYSLDRAYFLSLNNMRAPVTKPPSNVGLLTNNFASTTDDTWLKFISDLLVTAEYHYTITPEGRIGFAPNQTLDNMVPIWTFNDDNSSILLPEVTINRDIFSIPNVVEVIYSKSNGSYYATAENLDPDSPLSIPNRGRRIIRRETDPQVTGVASQGYIEYYARKLLRNLSQVQYTITFSHSYCPVTIGDCIELNYTRAGLNHVKAKITSQSIKCSTGCQVETTAVYTKNMWEG